MVEGISGAVLVGGESLRMGRDKAMLSVDGQLLVQRVVGILREVVDEVLLVGTGSERYGWLEARPVDDLVPGRGPLGGIHTALSLISHSHCLVVACDMPFLKPNLLRYMLREAAGWDAVVPLARGRLEPMHTVYARSCLMPIERMLESGELSPLDLFHRVRARYLEEHEVQRFDPGGHSFVNLNTPDDLLLARILGGLSPRGGVDEEIPLAYEGRPA